MHPKNKIIPLMILTITLTLLFPLSTVQSYNQTSQTILENQALQYLTEVYNLDFNHYNITLHDSYMLSSGPNDSAVYESVNYFLNSSDST